MWLRRLVGIVMIAVCIGLNALTVIGLLAPAKKPSHATTSSSQASVESVPTLTLTSSPSSITAGSNSALSWSTSGNPSKCVASGNWGGEKTIFGSESTGRISQPGNYTYALVCENSAGKAEASTTITVGNVPAPQVSSTTKSTPSLQTARYCGGRLPCYGPHDVASHNTKGNCWGWNKDRVINISGFDAAYHEAKSGVSSIEVSQICGKDLSSSLNGGAEVEGQSHDHNQTTKDNSDANVIPYFVGYFDNSKP
jgi:hypothetical protein